MNLKFSITFIALILSIATYCQNSTLGDYVWMDSNGNGIQDVGENGIGGVTVTCYDASNSNIIGTAVSNSDGVYDFILSPGTYYLHFSDVPGLFRSQQYANPPGYYCYPTCITADSDPNPSTGYTGIVTLNAGDLNRLYDAGYTSILPIKIKHIYVQSNYTFSRIIFTTASEVNNAGFDIERSADGISFEKIGWIDGNGNTSDEKHYTFTDTKPLVGMNYYRLRQIDFDGRFEYSHIVSVTFETDEVEIYPNPATDILFILGGKKDSYMIYNLLGEIIKSFPISESTSLDIEDLNPGIYWIKSMNKGQAMRFVKL